MLTRFINRRLSRKLFLMTLVFVMIAEILIFIPSLAVFRQDWLEDRAERAAHLSLALMSAPNYSASETLSEQFMKDTDIVLIAVKEGGRTALILGEPPEVEHFEVIDLRTSGNFPAIGQTFKSFFGRGGGQLRVLSNPVVQTQDSLEYIVPEASLKQAMRDYCHRIFLLSLVIAAITGLLLYLSLTAMIVGPVTRLARHLALFRDKPEAHQDYPLLSHRQDEIGQLEREFQDMKQGVRTSLKQQKRLATLGLAVAKINHDLRNVLTSAQLISDRLAMDQDERVAHMGSRLVRAVNRGVKLCTDVLNFTQTPEEKPTFEPVRISMLAGEAASDVIPYLAGDQPSIDFINDIPTDLTLRVDPDHTYRIFHNLFRNAVQAMLERDENGLEHVLRVSVRDDKDHVRIDVMDTGGGIPKAVRERLFKIFSSASAPGSTGLGLTISRELARGMGGDLSLRSSGDEGTVFTIELAKTD